ncbi:MAG: diadenylate cyclase [Syntrophales bacterium]|nr:diadenylate cyclase [Syntrophales bacterium]
MDALNGMILEFTAKLEEQISARAVLVNRDLFSEVGLKPDQTLPAHMIFITRGREGIEEIEKDPVVEGIITIPDVNVTRLSQMKIAIIKGMTEGKFVKGDKLICLTGIQRLGYIDSIFVIDVESEFEVLASQDISDFFHGVHPEVFEAILNISLELAAQGREGRPVGTIFVIGDHEKVLQLSRQMIINPFMGYPEEERNVMDRDLRDTIKEFSALDGAFVVREDGVLMTAGRHLNVALESGKEFPKGLGSRHISAAGVTNVTDAIAIVVSESTGTVRIFRKGRIFVDIEKALV